MSCELIPVSSQSVVIILLPGKQVIGRSRETKIKDAKCSKKQVECDVQPSTGTVILQVLGTNPSIVNGKEVQQGKTATLRHGDTLHLTKDVPQYTVHFRPAKRPLDDVSDSKDLAEPSATRKRKDSNSMAVDASETTEEVWTAEEKDALYVFMTKGVKPSSKIAAFDLDGTLITTKSGKVFAKNADDWQIIYPSVPGILKQLSKDGYKIVVMTNQMGISKGKLTVADLRTKLRSIAGRLGVPLQCLVSPADGLFRKPRVGMWTFLCDKGNGGLSVDVSESFYCGDAAGRLDKWAEKRKKDFSCSDRLFALNIGLAFCTPEERFCGEKPTKKYQMPEFDPKGAVEAAKREPAPNIASDKQEVLVMVGAPGSGKSHIARHLLQPAGYVPANRDTLKSWQKCVQAVESALKDGSSAAVDNTNGDRESRRRYIEVARRLAVPVRCLLMTATIQQAKHNNKFRELTETNHDHVSEMVFNMYKSRYQEPTLDEGFSEIVRVPCRPVFSDRERERLYSMYLLEK